MGISQRKGISNKGQGRPYEMNKIHFAVPVETIDTPNMTLSGFGYSERDLDIDPLCIDQFEKVKPLTEVNVTVEPKPNNFSQTWVVGLSS
ncbi:hypothetical protein [Vibrio quintilis]|nr:hypothetical protein [Vibrio quintilis]